VIFLDVITDLEKDYGRVVNHEKPIGMSNQKNTLMVSKAYNEDKEKGQPRSKMMLEDIQETPNISNNNKKQPSKKPGASIGTSNIPSN
jgi:hypothetical protein